MVAAKRQNYFSYLVGLVSIYIRWHCSCYVSSWISKKQLWSFSGMLKELRTLCSLCSQEMTVAFSHARSNPQHLPLQVSTPTCKLFCNVFRNDLNRMTSARLVLAVSPLTTRSMLIFGKVHRFPAIIGKSTVCFKCGADTQNLCYSRSQNQSFRQHRVLVCYTQGASLVCFRRNTWNLDANTNLWHEWTFHKRLMDRLLLPRNAGNCWVIWGSSRIRHQNSCLRCRLQCVLNVLRRSSHHWPEKWTFFQYCGCYTRSRHRANCGRTFRGVGWRNFFQKCILNCFRSSALLRRRNRNIHRW